MESRGFPSTVLPDEVEAGRVNPSALLRASQNWKNTSTPRFFVSVASKGFSSAVSLLFATLARRSISVAAKGFMEAGFWRESNGLGWKDSGGVRRTAWRASMAGRAGKNLADPRKTL
jgi:hypothetical protein